MTGIAHKVPRHIAIIMDGNGRWAKARNFPKIEGHRRGADKTKEIILAAKELGVEYLTLYAFSSENWGRPKEEVSGLMDILKLYIIKETNYLINSNIKVEVIGDLTKIPASTKKHIDNIVEATKKNNGITVLIAFSYGAREEIAKSCRDIAKLYAEKKIDLEDINENMISNHLYTSHVPDPDLLIRTSGEFRISNFLLWQLAYTELFFTKVNWPDFSVTDLKAAIEEFQQRERRYGK